MTAPNMAAITASLERSLQNCSLKHHHHRRGVGTEADHHLISISSEDSTSLDLNSHISLPYHWEQCLDLKSGEVYYINWRTGMKSKQDPRTRMSGELYSEDDDDSCSYDSEGSSPESSSSYSRQQSRRHNNNGNGNGNEEEQEEEEDEKDDDDDDGSNGVLVVGGCKSCLMYFMVPKQVDDCPKCSAQLLHFDRSIP